jgi:uncharacterized protein (UPF0276 family)
MANADMKTGIGLRTQLHAEILEQKPDVGFLEVHSENYFGETPFRHDLLTLRNDYDISLHGVGLSLGRADELDKHHLESLKCLVDEVEPLFISEHLAWSAYSHRHLPDLLPLPLTQQSFTVMCEHVELMQERLKRHVLIENPSNYLVFDLLQIEESEFLNQLASRTGCGILLDLNNVFVSAENLDRDAQAYIEQLDTQFIQQYHLAGHVKQTISEGSALIDSHSCPVSTEVWNLFEKTLTRHGDKPTLIEWDSHLPGLSVLLNEAAKADNQRQKREQILQVEEVSRRRNSARSFDTIEKVSGLENLTKHQSLFIDNVLLLDTENVIKSSTNKRMNIYTNNIFIGLLNYLTSVFPVSQCFVGTSLFKEACRDCVRNSPPYYGNVHEYGKEFKAVLKQYLESDSAVSEFPFLIDLIDFEWEKHRVFFSNKNPDGLIFVTSDINKDMLLNQKIHLSPHVSVMRSAYPILELYYQALPELENSVSVGVGDGLENVLIYKNKKKSRPCLEIINIEEAVFTLLNSTKDGVFLFDVINRLSESFETETLSHALAFAMKKELIVMNQGLVQ